MQLLWFTACYLTLEATCQTIGFVSIVLIAAVCECWECFDQGVAVASLKCDRLGECGLNMRLTS